MPPRKITEGDTALVSKITPKDLGNPRAAAALDYNDPNAAHFLGEVMGRATGTKAVVDARTDSLYHPLTGDFMAIRGTDSKKIRSGVLYLPGGIHDLLKAAFEGDDPAREVEFWYEIWTKPVSTPPGYAYMLVNKVQTARTDPLAHLMEQRQRALASDSEDGVSEGEQPEASEAPIEATDDTAAKPDAGKGKGGRGNKAAA